MDLDQSEARFASYIAGLGSVVGHAERMRPLGDYCTGLVLPGERKSVEPMAVRTAPARTAAQHQSLPRLVAPAPWPDQAVLSRVRERVLASITGEEPIQALIIDDTGFPKNGSHSVGVARQYCGQLGKRDNSGVRSLSMISGAISGAIARSAPGCGGLARMTVAQRGRQGR